MASTGKLPQLRKGLTIEAPDNLGMTTSCISCISFIEKSEYCQKYTQKPPARVIAFGCESYFDREEIPF